MKGENSILAEMHGVGSVRVCDCGSVHLSIGAVTLHLDADTFLRSSFMLHLAANQLISRRDSQESSNLMHDAINRDQWIVH